MATIDYTHWVQGVFHLIPLILAGKALYKHDQWRRSSPNDSRHYAEETAKMTHSILQLLLFITVYLSIDSFFSLHKIEEETSATATRSLEMQRQLMLLTDIKRNTDVTATCASFPATDSIQRQFPPVLGLTFGSYIRENSTFFKDGIQSGKLIFQLDRFESAYIMSLDYLIRKYPDQHPTLYATSLPSEKYFWTHIGPLKPAEREIRSFIQRGGKVKRVFYVDDDWRKDPVATSILQRQVDSMGVDVWTINVRYVPASERRLYVVNHEQQFMWEVYIDSKEEISRGTYFTAAADIAPILRCFKDLEKNPAIEHYSSPSHIARRSHPSPSSVLSARLLSLRPPSATEKYGLP